jgi:hypothetical protein
LANNIFGALVVANTRTIFLYNFNVNLIERGENVSISYLNHDSVHPTPPKLVMLGPVIAA